MGFGERVCVIVACDVLVRIVVIVGDTIFRFPRVFDVVFIFFEFFIFVSCCYLWFGVFIGIGSSFSSSLLRCVVS